MTRRSYIWTYGIPKGKVVYNFTHGRPEGSLGPREFLGDFEGSSRAVVILSLVETCRRLEVNPYEYLDA